MTTSLLLLAVLALPSPSQLGGDVPDRTAGAEEPNSGRPSAADAPASVSPSETRTPDAGTTERPGRPRLVVLLSVDQLIPDQLERLGPDLAGGLGRLLREGRSLPGAALPYARTETGAGHTTLSTGCLPRTHGVVGNTFYERSTRSERYCVEDPDAMEVSSLGIAEDRGRRSPVTLLAPTLAELVQRSLPGARVCSISTKDRAAIGMAGRADGTVLWWDKSRGTGFLSSNAYGDALPDFVDEWNAGWRPRGRAFVWTDTSPVGADADAAHARWRSAPDERAGERPFGPSGVTFPYPVPARIKDTSLGGFLYGTPATDGYVLEVARRAVDVLELGADDATDVLCLSFSATDIVGHANGPYSREVTDVLFRLDRGLGALFALLDERVGRDGWIASLTSDHGVLPLPEHVVALGGDARRVPRGDLKKMRRALAEFLELEFGHPVVLRSAPGGYSLDESALEEHGTDPVRARAAAAAELRTLAGAFDWIHTAYSYEEVGAFDPEAGGVEGRLARSFHPERTADVVFVAAPGALLGYSRGTTHGSPHDYDRGIPLLFYGPGADRVAPPEGRAPGSHDIVPTIVEWIELDVDARFDGRSLLQSPPR
ncbi:MAG: alkaline phosphatase family protein [Planctomycetota bacterium]